MIFNNYRFFFVLFLSFLISFPNFNKKLSDYNIYSGDPHNLMTTSNYITFELITPLFSDYAYKHRSIFIPKNKKIKYFDKRVFEFPIGTIISKTFYYPHNFNDISKGISLKETRIMIHQENGWIGLPYVWNDEGTEAYLEIAGDIKYATWVDYEDNTQIIDYVVPNMNQCKGCHVNNTVFKPIGPSAKQLNKEVYYNGVLENQLQRWKKIGILETIPNIDNIPKIAKWDDEHFENINDRARAWLDINCAHCHNEEGPANNTGLYLDYYEKDSKLLGIYKTPVAAGRGSGNLKYDIVPGYPEKSIMVYRFESTNPGIMMPELGRTMVHKEGLDLIKKWILSLN